MSEVDSRNVGSCGKGETPVHEIDRDSRVSKYPGHEPWRNLEDLSRLSTTHRTDSELVP